MAPAADSSYFPPLDKSLAGDVRPISWRTAYRALCDETTAVEKSHLAHFINDPETIARLSRTIESFPGPDAQSATDFDTKTAPINVSQSSNGNYKLEEIKDDAKWLSKELQIEELEALRIAIVEWQERPSDQLLNAGTQQLAHAGNVSLGSSILAQSTANLSASLNGHGAQTILDFGEINVRRKRLVDVFLSEKLHMLKLSADLVTRAAVSKNNVQGIHTGTIREHKKTTWIDEAAEKIVAGTSLSGEGTEQKCISKLEAILRRVGDSSSWPKVFTEEPKRAQSYVESQFLELISILRLLLARIYAMEGIPSATIVQAWFALMENCNFLQDGGDLYAAIEIPQLLVSVVSVEILKLQLAVGELMNAAGADDGATLQGNFYIKDDGCVRFLNTYFQTCAEYQIRIAAPAIQAWGVIVSVVQDIAQIHQHAREHRIEQRDYSARRASVDLRSEFEKMYQDAICVAEWETTATNTATRFLSIAVDEMDLFGLITGLAVASSTTFVSNAESNTAFICKEALLDLVRDTLPFIQYDVPILDALLSILSSSELSPATQKHASVLASKIVFDHEQLRPGILDQAVLRYPYELSPMLRLFAALAGAKRSTTKSLEGPPEIITYLDNLHTYTQSVDQNFSAYRLVDEESNSNAMVLDADLPIFTTRKAKLSRHSGHSQRALPWKEQEDEPRVLRVTAGTTGAIVKESRPFVLKLDHSHSGLEYLGLLLSTFLASSESIPAADMAVLDRQTAAETVSLFAALISAALDQRNGREEAIFVIGRLSYSLQDGQDIISVIAEVFEIELLAHLDQVAQEGSLELVIACVDFLNTIVKISPERSWSVLARSSLLGVADGAASLVSVVLGTEGLLGRYRFFRACVQLHSLLLDDAIAGLVKRKAQVPKSANRFASASEYSDMTPERTMSAVLNAYQKILLDAFHSIPDWKIESPLERSYIVIGILDAFTQLFRSTYGVNVTKEPTKRLTSVLAPAANALLAACSKNTESNPLLMTFARFIPNGLQVAADTIPVHVRGLLIDQTLAAFRFLTLLVRITRSGLHLPAKNNREREESRQRAIQFSSSLLKQMPAFAPLLASDHAFKTDLCQLLTELVDTVGSGEAEPPSILAQLNADAQKSFLEVITQLDRPVCDVEVERRVWDFLSAVMGGKQQWFAAYLLTGSLPKKRPEHGGTDTAKGRPLVGYVLDQLASIATLAPERAIGMLKFLATAQRSWVWVTNDLRSHANFLVKTLGWVESLGEAPKDSEAAASGIFAREYQMASYLCDILAISLHVSLETGDKSILKIVTPNLTFLRQHGTKVNAYNRSLHRNLAENLKGKFSTSELSDFSRTAINTAPYGDDYYYDKQFAASVLQHDLSWHGATKGRNKGFSDEFTRANANLSLLHAQTQLLESWKTLATTLCKWADHDVALQTQLAEVAKTGLSANADAQIDEPGVADVLDTRAELAFVLIARLVALKAENSMMKELLPEAWRLVGTSPVDYDVATAAADVRYYRELLQILYLTIQPHSYGAKAQQSRAADQSQLVYLPSATSSCLLDIVGRVIAPGFRALCGNLHQNPELAIPADFALLTALLQAILTVPGIGSIGTLLADMVAGSSLIRGALSLYSWADRIAEAAPGRDPVYGETAVMFLLALSTVRPIAEQMALDGVLTQLASSNLSNYFRKTGGKGPFDEPPRMFVIWTECLLPLCLNLLDSVGPPIAAEVAAFLNTFPEQLRRAEKALQNEAPSARNPKAGAVTLGLVLEAHSLLTISAVLSSDMARAAAEGINAADIPTLDYDVEGVRTLVEALSRSTKSLSSRITPVSALQEKWMGTPVSGASDNALQAKIFKEVTSIKECFGGPES